MPAPEIVVVGSINFDLFLIQDRVPARGETLLAQGLREGFGGKGANQAVQAARLGRRVSFIGAVGPDDRGTASRDNLAAQGITCRVDTSDEPTGLGVVNVLPDGSVHATVVPGANSSVNGELVRGHADDFDDAGYLILQNEIPRSGNLEAIAQAKRAGVRIVYNAAPANDTSLEDAEQCDYLIVNEEEAMYCLGRRLESIDQIRDAVPELAAHCPNVVVTLGADGALTCFGGEVRHLPPHRVNAIDTTGAGDSFVGAFTSYLATGVGADEAASLAAKIAAQTTTGMGAQTSMPTSAGGDSDDPLRASAEDPRDAGRV